MPRKRKAKKPAKKRIIAGKTYHLKKCWKRKSTAKNHAKLARLRRGELARILLVNGQHCVYVH